LKKKELIGVIKNINPIGLFKAFLKGESLFMVIENIVFLNIINNFQKSKIKKPETKVKKEENNIAFADLFKLILSK